MDYIISIAIGLATSFLGGILFLLFFLKQLVPKIVISEHISKVKREGKTSYEFKFVNHTKSGIFDVRIDPVFYKPYGDIEGMNLKSTDIKLVDNFISSISKKSKIDKTICMPSLYLDSTKSPKVPKTLTITLIISQLVKGVELV